MGFDTKTGEVSGKAGDDTGGHRDVKGDAEPAFSPDGESGGGAEGNRGTGGKVRRKRVPVSVRDSKGSIALNSKQRIQLEELDRMHKLDPKWWDLVLARIGQGESTWTLAEENHYFPSVFRYWIRSNDEREAAYQRALEERKETWIESLQVRAARGASATILDAKTASGEWLDVNLWPKGLLAACESVEFGPDGTPYKIRMDSGKHAERLAKYVGLDKQEGTSVNVYSLVGILSEMPKAKTIEHEAD